MSVVLEPINRLPKNLAVSDFERIRKEHFHKQIDFFLMQLINEFETKFDIGVED